MNVPTYDRANFMENGGLDRTMLRSLGVRRSSRWHVLLRRDEHRKERLGNMLDNA